MSDLFHALVLYLVFISTPRPFVPITDTGIISVSAADIPADIDTPLSILYLMGQYQDASRHRNI